LSCRDTGPGVEKRVCRRTQGQAAYHFLAIRQTYAFDLKIHQPPSSFKEINNIMTDTDHNPFTTGAALRIPTLGDARHHSSQGIAGPGGTLTHYDEATGTRSTIHRGVVRGSTNPVAIDAADAPTPHSPATAAGPVSFEGFRNRIGDPVSAAEVDLDTVVTISGIGEMSVRSALDAGYAVMSPEGQLVPAGADSAAAAAPGQLSLLFIPSALATEGFCKSLPYAYATFALTEIGRNSKDFCGGRN